jgi:hypothetical protein
LPISASTVVLACPSNTTQSRVYVHAHVRGEDIAWQNFFRDQVCTWDKTWGLLAVSSNDCR